MSRDSGAHVLSVVVLNQKRELTRLGELAERYGEECGLSEDDTMNICLVLDEMVSNVIKYGHDDGLEHQIHVRVRVEADLLTIQIEDDGKAFNPLETAPPDLDLPVEQRPIGGLGVFIVKSMAESLDYRRERDRNIFTMTKRTESRR